MRCLLASFFVLGLIVICQSQNLLSSTTYPNCIASPSEPCVEVRRPSPREGGGSFWNDVGLAAAPCAVSSDGSSVFVSDFRGLTIRDTAALGVTADVPLECSNNVIVNRQYGGDYFMSFGSNEASISGNTASSCYCREANNCHEPVLHFKSSSGSVWNTSLPVLSQYYGQRLWQTDSDIVEVPVVWIQNCSGAYPWNWLPNPAGPSAIALRSQPIPTGCPLDSTITWYKWLSEAGYHAVIDYSTSSTAYRSSTWFGSMNNFTTMLVHRTDGDMLLSEIQAGHSVNVSYGPSYVDATTSSGNVPPGFGRVNAADGTITSDTSSFLTADYLIDESRYGGREDVIWAINTDGSITSTTMINMSDPANPTYTEFNGPNPTIINVNHTINPAVDGTVSMWNGDGIFPLECPVDVCEDFECAINNAALASSVAFFTSGSDSYALLGYGADNPCFWSVVFGGYPMHGNYDIWRTSVNPPELVDRFVLDHRAEQFLMFAYANGFLFFTNYSGNNAEQWYIGVGPAGFDGAGMQMWLDTALPNDVMVLERRTFSPNQILVNFGRSGLVIYDVDGSGIVGRNVTIPSGYTSADSASNGDLISCGNGDVIAINNGALAPAGAPEGLYSSVQFEVWQPFAAPAGVSTSTTGAGATTGTTAAASGSSTSTSTTTTTSSSSTTGGSSGCALPDICNAQCSPPPKASKLPKPSVAPTKVPAASKVPKPEYFTVEITFSSTTQSECDSLDCCDVRSLLGDTTASNYWRLCDSTSASGRAPEFNKNECTIFIFALEGTSSNGGITQSDFEAAQSELDASCVTSDCKFTAKSGQSYSTVLSSAGSTITSITITLAALCCLLL